MADQTVEPIVTPAALAALGSVAGKAVDGLTRDRMEMAHAAARLLAGLDAPEVEGALSTLAIDGPVMPALKSDDFRALGALLVTHILGLDRFAEVAGGIRDYLASFVASKDELIASQARNIESLDRLNATMGDNNTLLREQVNALLQQNEELRRRNAELEQGDEWKAGADEADPEDA